MMRSREFRIVLIGLVPTALAVWALIVWVDLPVAAHMAQYSETGLIAAFRIITMLANGAIWYTLAVLGIALAWRKARKVGTPDAQVEMQRHLRAWVFMIASMAISGLLVNALKVAIGRPRPKLVLYENISGLAPFQRALEDCSFPSGHSQSIWAAMLALAWIYPRWRFAFFAVAVVVAASRVIIGTHYASDVVAGAYLAFAIAFLARWWFQREGLPVTLAAPKADRA